MQGQGSGERIADAGSRESGAGGVAAAVLSEGSKGLGEGPAQQKCSPALAGSRALDQSDPVPEQSLLLLHGEAFARRPAAPHERL
jgi:hypothetical protein